MTPAQRKYDLDLAKSMQAMAQRVAPRSLKVAAALTLGAERITALLALVPEENDNRTPVVRGKDKQPASTPDTFSR